MENSSEIIDGHGSSIIEISIVGEPYFFLQEFQISPEFLCKTFLI